MSTRYKAPIGLVPVERRWLKALTAVAWHMWRGTGFRRPFGTRFRKSTQSREIQP